MLAPIPNSSQLFEFLELLRDALPRCSDTCFEAMAVMPSAEEERSTIGRPTANPQIAVGTSRRPKAQNSFVIRMAVRRDEYGCPPYRCMLKPKNRVSRNMVAWKEFAFPAAQGHGCQGKVGNEDVPWPGRSTWPCPPRLPWSGSTGLRVCVRARSEWPRARRSGTSTSDLLTVRPSRRPRRALSEFPSADVRAPDNDDGQE